MLPILSSPLLGGRIVLSSPSLALWWSSWIIVVVIIISPLMLWLLSLLRLQGYGWLTDASSEGGYVLASSLNDDDDDDDDNKDDDDIRKDPDVVGRRHVELKIVAIMVQKCKKDHSR